MMFSNDNSSHHWVTFTKGRIHVTGCSNCGQVLMPTNEDTSCHKVPVTDNMLVNKGFRITGAVQAAAAPSPSAA